MYVIGVVLQFQETSRILGLDLMLLVIFYFSLQMLTGLLRAFKMETACLNSLAHTYACNRFIFFMTISKILNMNL